MTEEVLSKMENALDIRRTFIESEEWTTLRAIELIEEIKRLKRGDFTEEEFQNLCHNFSEEDKDKFRQGCVDYQKKLFGE